MSQHVSETCIESNGQWLPITEYSVKSGMSLSTIRRKIKSNGIAYRLDKGKYLIFFGNKKMNNITSEIAPKVVPATPTSVRRHSDEIAVAIRSSHSEKRESIVQFGQEEDAFHRVSDAYEHALHKKDDRIKLLEERNRELEDRLNELRLLVQVLEEKYEVRY